MNKIEPGLLEYRAVLLAVVFGFVACVVLYLISWFPVFGIVNGTGNPGAPENRVRIVSLECKQGSHVPDFIDAELRITSGRFPFKKLYTWRNKMGKNKKAFTWYLDEVIDAEGGVCVELVEINMGAGRSNRVLGSREIPDCPFQMVEGGFPSESGGYVLHWEKVKSPPASR